MTYIDSRHALGMAYKHDIICSYWLIDSLQSLHAIVRIYSSGLFGHMYLILSPFFTIRIPTDYSMFTMTVMLLVFK